MKPLEVTEEEWTILRHLHDAKYAFNDLSEFMVTVEVDVARDRVPICMWSLFIAGAIAIDVEEHTVRLLPKGAEAEFFLGAGDSRFGIPVSLPVSSS